MLEYLSFHLTEEDYDAMIMIEIHDQMMTKVVMVNGEEITRTNVPALSYLWFFRSFDKLNLSSWASAYYGGEGDVHWSIDYRYPAQKTRHIEGDLAIPIDYYDLLHLLDQFAPEAGLIEEDTLDVIDLIYSLKINPEIEGVRSQLYQERLTIDRLQKKITYQRAMGQDCVITHEIVVKVMINRLMDVIEEYMERLPDDEEEEEGQSKLRIILSYHDQTEYIHEVHYNRRGLPDDWDELMRAVGNLLDFFGMFGNMFDHHIYHHGVHHDEWIYAQVRLSDTQETHYYLTEDDHLYVGDRVIVSDLEGYQQEGTITRIDYYRRNEWPVPPEELNRIISLSSEKETLYEDYLKTVN
ncbi:MAG: hypothetical protein ACSW8B_05650 [bacterium]